MKPQIIVLAATLLFGARFTYAEAPGSGGSMVPATSPNILVEGRCIRTPSGGMRLGFPGTVFHLRCRGAALAMRINSSSNEVYFDVQIDGSDACRLRCSAGEADYPLIQGATAGVHSVEITRRSESWEGTCEVIGFVPGAGTEMLQPPALPERRLMFIGDSITCGAATDIRPNDPLKGKTAHEDQNGNARLSFGMILARRLHAQCQLVSYGGRGVLRDWQGIKTLPNAPQFYELAMPDDPSVLWNPADYVPDAIVICLGTNDFNQGIPDQNDFVNTYVEFVRKIRRDAPHAKVFLADSPMVNDSPSEAPKHSVLRGYLLEVLAKIDNPDVILAPVHHYAGVPNNGHPTGADHEAIAGEIEPLLRHALNW